jgi:hypothetical protein
MVCKCGSRRKKHSPDFCIIRLREVRARLPIALSPQGNSPVFLETAEEFCSKPAALWHLPELAGITHINSVIDSRWRQMCECNPQKGSYRTVVSWHGVGYDSNGNVQGTVLDAHSTFTDTRPPEGLQVVSVPLNSTEVSWRVLIQPRTGEPYFLGTLLDRTTGLFQFTLDGVSTTFTPSGCYSPQNPPAPLGGDYPGQPEPPNVEPPPAFSLPDLPPVDPKAKIKPIPVPVHLPPEECCDCE